MIRTAVLSDIPRLTEIRGAVGENRLSDPSRVTLADYVWHIERAPVFVWDDAGLIKGLSAGDPRDGSIWALFVDPAFEHQGIGQAAHPRRLQCARRGWAPCCQAEHRPRHTGGAVLSAQRLAS
jgi:GNAT superfamily N-acetyltransferase